MILGIEKELTIFLQAALSGNLVYLVYCALCVFRRMIKHNEFWISVGDLVYWIGTGFYLFLKMYQTSHGIIRWYFVVGVLAGAWVTHRIIRKFTKKYIAKRGKRE